jgi:hypothetical protein
MRTASLRLLTWATAAAAVSSAAWLSSLGPAALLCATDLRTPPDAVELGELMPEWSAPAAGPSAADPSAPSAGR